MKRATPSGFHRLAFLLAIGILATVVGGGIVLVAARGQSAGTDTVRIEPARSAPTSMGAAPQSAASGSSPQSPSPQSTTATPTAAPAGTSTATVPAAPVTSPAGQVSTATAAGPAPSPSAAPLTLEQKVGQMMMFGFAGADGSGPIASLIQDRHVGNVVLLGDNVRDPAQLRALSGRMQASARNANGGVGMLIAVDQEGGDVQRLGPPNFTALPAARRMAASGDPARVRTWAQLTAGEMRAGGLNMDLAPVLDVNDNPANPVIGDRAFGVEPGSVITYGLAFLDGLEGAGIAGVAKHFPGHGNTSQDSHLTLPYVNKSDAALRAVELAPFQAAIAHGVDGVMVAHVVYTAWDPDRPASLSPVIVSGILRGQLGYDGVVMTDDMNMQAITDEYGPGEAAVMAVEAGVDIILLAGPPSAQAASVDAVLNAVKSGRIPESRIDQSVRRILTLKAAHGLAPGR